jgi:hypothetical protein
LIAVFATLWLKRFRVFVTTPEALTGAELWSNRPICQRIAFAESATGQTVLETEPKGAAAKRNQSDR